MAVGEDFIDFVSWLTAVAGRTAGPERRFEHRSFCSLAPDPPAGHAFGLARQVFERQLEGLEPAGDALAVDEAIGRRRGRWPEGVHPGIVSEEKNARGIFCVFYAALAQLRKILPRIEELEGGDPVSAALADDFPLWHGTRGRHLHHKAAGRDDDKAAHGGFGGPEDAQHGAVEGVRNPRRCGVACKPEHGEKGRNYGVERFAVAFDGQVPVHGVSLSHKKTKQEHKWHIRNIIVKV